MCHSIQLMNDTSFNYPQKKRIVKLQSYQRIKHFFFKIIEQKFHKIKDKTENNQNSLKKPKL